MSHRPEQITSTLHRAVQSVIARGLNDPRISGLISVTKVEVAPDKRTATVFVSVLPADRAELAMHGLQSAAAHVRNRVGELVEMRRMPIFTFELDESLKKQAEVFAAIQRGVEATRKDAPGARTDEPDQFADDSGAHGRTRRNPTRHLTDKKDD